MSLDPFKKFSDEFLPVYESDHSPPEKSRKCRRCGQTMRFTHYDCLRVLIRNNLAPNTSFYAIQIAVFIAILLSGGLVGLTIGPYSGILAMLISVPVFYRLGNSLIERRAVWRCKQCDAYFIGPSLTKWDSP